MLCQSVQNRYDFTLFSKYFHLILTHITVRQKLETNFYHTTFQLPHYPKAHCSCQCLQNRVAVSGWCSNQDVIRICLNSQMCQKLKSTSLLHELVTFRQVDQFFPCPSICLVCPILPYQKIYRIFLLSSFLPVFLRQLNPYLVLSKPACYFMNKLYNLNAISGERFATIIPPGYLYSNDLDIQVFLYISAHSEFKSLNYFKAQNCQASVYKTNALVTHFYCFLFYIRLKLTKWQWILSEYPACNTTCSLGSSTF